MLTGAERMLARRQLKRGPLCGFLLANVRDWSLGTGRRLLLPAATALGVALVTACNDTMGPRPSVTVAVLSQPTPSYAADSDGRQLILCEVALQARNGGQESAGWMDATFAFYAVNDSRTPFAIDTIPADTIRSSWGADSIGIGQNSDETARWDVIADVPFTLRMRYAYGWAIGLVDSSDVSLACEPPITSGPPPTITALQDQGDTAPQPGDILHLSYAATSSVGLWQSYVEVAGPCDVVVPVAENLQQSVSHSVDIPLPAACTLSIPPRVTVTTLDLGLQHASRSMTLPALVDHRPPNLVVGVSTPYSELYTINPLATFSGYLFTGDPITVLVRANDNHALHAVYWEILPAGLRDSLFARDSAITDTFSIPTAPNWNGTIQLRFWTRDASGNVSDTLTSAPGAIQVERTVGPTPTLTTIPGDISDVAFDMKRGVIYLLQSNAGKISVFSPASLTIVRTIPLPDYAQALDLTPSGDSIVTVLKNSQAIGIVDLTPASPVLQAVSLPLDASYKLQDIRVAAMGRALIATQNVSGGVERLYIYDLAAGTLQLRADAPNLGQYSNGLFERSTDRNVIVVNGSAQAFARYDAGTDAFGPAMTPQVDNARPSLDSTGAHVAVFGGLYDPALQYRLTVTAALRGYGNAAFSPDGQTHYMAIPPTFLQGVWTSPGVVRSRVSDGSIIDRIPVIMLTTLVRMSPDGSTLVAVESQTNSTAARIAVINLNQLH